jgi:branched-subunit amino acid ABC-type transport system permease component
MWVEAAQSGTSPPLLRLAASDPLVAVFSLHSPRNVRYETQMNFFLTIVVDGLIQASWLFIVALGMTLVFGVLKILNIAHGSFYALGAYIAATAVTMVAAHSLPPSVGFVAMLVSVALIASAVGFLLERGLLKMFYGRDEVVLLLVTYAVFPHPRGRHKLIWGVNPVYATQPMSCSAMSPLPVCTTSATTWC